MLTFKGVVMPHEQKKDKTYNVKIQITYQRRVKRISTSIFVKPEDLTKSFKIKNPDITKQVDNLIESYRSIYAGLQIELNDYSLEDIVSIIKEERNKITYIDFIQFSKEWIATSTCKGAKNYEKEHFKNSRVSSTGMLRSDGFCGLFHPGNAGGNRAYQSSCRTVH